MCDWPFSTALQLWLDASECIVIDGSNGHTGAPNRTVVRATQHYRSSLLAGFSDRITLYLSKFFVVEGKDRVHLYLESLIVLME